jgi:hypothetical protein
MYPVQSGIPLPWSVLAGLSRFAVDLVYMPWSRTPVVPTGRRCNVCRRTSTFAPRSRARGPVDIASAPSDWLGHHRTYCFSELDPFTPEALRPAYFLSTHRGPPRDGNARKTRYCDPKMFPQTGLGPCGPHPLVNANFVTHRQRTYQTAPVACNAELREGLDTWIPRVTSSMRMLSFTASHSPLPPLIPIEFGVRVVRPSSLPAGSVSSVYVSRKDNQRRVSSLTSSRLQIALLVRA